MACSPRHLANSSLRTFPIVIYVVICSLTHYGNSISQHHYSGTQYNSSLQDVDLEADRDVFFSGSFCSGNGALLQDLMTKANIRGNLSNFSPDVTAVRAKGLDYVLGYAISFSIITRRPLLTDEFYVPFSSSETNSFSCHGAPGVSNTAGSALWTLDYALFAAQMGISRVHFHEGIGFKYNLVGFADNFSGI